MNSIAEVLRILLASLVSAACQQADANEDGVITISYSSDIRPVWTKHCLICHEGRRFDAAEGAYEFLLSSTRQCQGFVEEPWITPYEPTRSLLWRALAADSQECIRAMPASISEFPDDPVYPPGGLKAFDIEAFEKVETWILEGAHGN